MSTIAVALRVAIAAGLVLAGACAPAQTEPSLARPYPDDTSMGVIQERGVVRIGLPRNAPPLARFERGGLRAEGLAADLGALIADTLGVPVEWRPAPKTRLLALIDRKGEADRALGAVDLAFLVEPITEALARSYTLTNPYFIAHQRLLVPAGSQTEITGLEGDRVCEFLDEETGVALDELAAGIEVVPASSPARCARLLATGKVDAATAADAALLHMLADLGGKGGSYEVAGDDLTTEGYGVAVAGGATSFVQFINSVLARASEDGVWEDYYRSSVTALSSSVEPEPPQLTVGEAAALYPQGAG